ncbi:MAG TPA: hypothetical protein VLU46_13275 [Thermoanaerobaculia bacterium]|nr:hypothetical protein [Thermoanaerobaculia bacterium]
MADEVRCPECGSPRPDPSTTCPTCGAPPIRPDEHRKTPEEVRTEDLEPYVTLTYIARIFKVLAALVAVVMIFEVVLGFMQEGRAAIITVVGEATQLLVISGVLWAAGDIMVLLIDLGHDIRVSRILLGRINAEMHRRNEDVIPSAGEREGSRGR